MIKAPYLLLWPSLSTDRIMVYYRMYEWREKAWMIVHVQDDLNLNILRILKGTFLLDAAWIFLINSIGHN